MSDALDLRVLGQVDSLLLAGHHDTAILMRDLWRHRALLVETLQTIRDLPGKDSVEELVATALELVEEV